MHSTSARARCDADIKIRFRNLNSEDEDAKNTELAQQCSNTSQQQCLYRALVEWGGYRNRTYVNILKDILKSYFLLYSSSYYQYHIYSPTVANSIGVWPCDDFISQIFSPWTK